MPREAPARATSRTSSASSVAATSSARRVVVGQSPHPLVERRLELFGQWQTFGQRFGTGQLGVGERSRELDEGQRVAARW